ncbi:MAG: hypothetical protein A3E80_05300 [Chlamydiae bacterium RIFCSPHIGHO2_12_FULL_49_9]|nr:MAG: hypothetical protein A3E80_05300 [Chlamydiae bacterium RIFCSPHIGHO2_12_FULL_49_9]
MINRTGSARNERAGSQLKLRQDKKHFSSFILPRVSKRSCRRFADPVIYFSCFPLARQIPPSYLAV